MPVRKRKKRKRKRKKKSKKIRAKNKTRGEAKPRSKKNKTYKNLVQVGTTESGIKTFRLRRALSPEHETSKTAKPNSSEETAPAASERDVITPTKHTPTKTGGAEIKTVLENTAPTIVDSASSGGSARMKWSQTSGACECV